MRRTARRVHRRHERWLNALPVGCISMRINGIAYWRCGSVFYEKVVREGATVYIMLCTRAPPPSSIRA